MKRRDVARAFGRALRNLRLERNISQMDLAQKANMDRTYPSLLERGLRAPTLPVILGLAKVLQMSPQSLLTRTLRELDS